MNLKETYLYKDYQIMFCKIFINLVKSIYLTINVSLTVHDSFRISSFCFQTTLGRGCPPLYGTFMRRS